MKHWNQLLTATSLIFAFCIGAAADDFIRTVALTGNPVVGATSGIEYANFGSPVLNNQGHTVFSAALRSPSGQLPSANDSGIWVETVGHVRLVAREGDQPPGAPAGMVFGSLFTPDPSNVFEPAINDAGNVAFSAPLSDGTSQTGSGIWAEVGGALRLYAQSGSQVPGANPEANFVSPSGWFAFNDLGQIGIATSTIVQTPGTLRPLKGGIWVGDHNAWRPVAEQGMHAPGRPPTIGFRYFGKHWGGFPTMNDAGQVAFWADLWPIDGPPPFPGSSATAGIWTDVSGALELIALEGEQAPGAPPGAVFYSLDSPISIFASPVLNTAGHVAFNGELQEGSGGVNSSNSNGIWLHSHGETNLVVRGGMQAHGMPNGNYFRWFSSPRLNSPGQVLFTGYLDTPDGFSLRHSGAWVVDSEGNFRLVAYAGQQVPGMMSGEAFEFVQAAGINAAGQAVIDTSHGIWAEDRSGTLQFIVRSGQFIDVDDGPDVSLRRILQLRFLGYSGNDDGRPSGFNDRGELAFHATFTDGSSGIFVSSLATIPEPSSAWLWVLGIVSLICQYRRKRLDLA